MWDIVGRVVGSEVCECAVDSEGGEVGEAGEGSEDIVWLYFALLELCTLHSIDWERKRELTMKSVRPTSRASEVM